VYLEPHHADIFDFLDLRKGHGAEERRARDLFTALWVSDLFMARVRANGAWTLFDPATAPGLNEVHGDAYEALYAQYERDGRGVRSVPAQTLWKAICVAITETGTPYMLNKDQCNRMSNQQHLGTIQSSNLCAEVVEYSSHEETAVCTLASVNLASFATADAYDFEALADAASAVTFNLNRVLDRSYRPVEEARRSDERHRPLGIGVSGLQDVFFIQNIAFDSDEARALNARIFEALYFGAVRESARLAEVDGAHASFPGSPASRGDLQFDLWRADDRLDPALRARIEASPLGWGDRWGALRGKVVATGLRNSLLVALMPTATSATIVGVTECMEPQTSNMYKRQVLSGEFMVVNPYLVKALAARGLWTPRVRDQIIAREGSVQGGIVPDDIARVFKTVWEHSMKVVLDMAFDRSPFVDQSQSLNMFMRDASERKITSMLFYAHARRLKTMMYYMRSRASSEAVKFALGGDEEESCEGCSA